MLFAFSVVWFVGGLFCLCWFVQFVVDGLTLASLAERGFLTMVPVCASTMTATIVTMSAAMDKQKQKVFGARH